jgi:hypothetical protein
MATKKDKTAAASKAVVSRGATRTVAQPATLAPREATNSQQLLREAAWSQMFGRAETKNPFAR